MDDEEEQNLSQRSDLCNEFAIKLLFIWFLSLICRRSSWMHIQWEKKWMIFLCYIIFSSCKGVYIHLDLKVLVTPEYAKKNRSASTSTVSGLSPPPYQRHFTAGHRCWRQHSTEKTSSRARITSLTSHRSALILRHKGKTARSALEIGTAALLMRRRTNQSRQSSFHKLTFNSTDSH